MYDTQHTQIHHRLSEIEHRYGVDRPLYPQTTALRLNLTPYEFWGGEMIQRNAVVNRALPSHPSQAFDSASRRPR